MGDGLAGEKAGNINLHGSPGAMPFAPSRLGAQEPSGGSAALGCAGASATFGSFFHMAAPKMSQPAPSLQHLSPSLYRSQPANV